MGYRNLQSCVRDLERHGQLLRIDSEIEPHLEAGAIQRRVYAAGGPALLFTRVKGCRFPMLGNLFGTLERTCFALGVERFDDVAARIMSMIENRPSEFQPITCGMRASLPTIPEGPGNR